MKMKINRHAYYGLVHKGVKALLLDRMGFYDDDEYRNYLGIHTGQTSCKDLSDESLRQLVNELKQQGYLEDSPRFKNVWVVIHPINHPVNSGPNWRRWQNPSAGKG